MAQIRQRKAANNSNNLQNLVQLQITDILKPFELGQIHIGAIFGNLFKPRRKLRPERKERPAVPLISTTKCNLLVQIIRGMTIQIFIYLSLLLSFIFYHTCLYSILSYITLLQALTFQQERKLPGNLQNNLKEILKW